MRDQLLLKPTFSGFSCVSSTYPGTAVGQEKVATIFVAEMTEKLLVRCTTGVFMTPTMPFGHNWLKFQDSPGPGDAGEMMGYELVELPVIPGASKLKTE